MPGPHRYHVTQPLHTCPASSVSVLNILTDCNVIAAVYKQRVVRNLVTLKPAPANHSDAHDGGCKSK